jgi:excisionase family DNA binding protein
MEHEYLTTREAARLLRVSPATVLRWCLHDGLPGLRLKCERSGRWRYRFRRADILARLERVTGVPQPAPPARLSAWERDALERRGLLKWVGGG